MTPAFPLCTDCHGPAQLVRTVTPRVWLKHACTDHDVELPFDNERRAAAHWRMTYARECPVLPVGGPVEAQVGSGAPALATGPLPEAARCPENGF